MAKFYGTLVGNRGEATRLGHSRIKVSAQSYDGSVITELTYNSEGKLMVDVKVSEDSTSCYGRGLFYGTFEEFIAKLGA
jgi:hypothetical protein